MAYQTAEPCPACGKPLLAEPRGIWRVCACGGLVTPPGVTAPYAAGTARQRPVRSQRERDLDAIGLASRKGIMLGELAQLGADDRLDPASLPVVEWFRQQVKDTASDGRLDELAELLPDAGIRRRRWWQGNSAAIQPADYDDGDGDGQDDDGDREEAGWSEGTAQAIAPPRPPAGLPPGRTWTLPGPAGVTTWAAALARLGWRIIPADTGCQVSEGAAACGAQANRGIGSGLVCGDHYQGLAAAIMRSTE